MPSSTSRLCTNLFEFSYQILDTSTVEWISPLKHSMQLSIYAKNQVSSKSYSHVPYPDKHRKFQNFFCPKLFPLRYLCFLRRRSAFITFLFFYFFIGIRHPEELSFSKPLEPSHLKCNLKDLSNRKKQSEHIHNGHSPADTNTFIPNGSQNGSTNSLDKNSPGYLCAPVTPIKQSSTPIGSPLGVSVRLRTLLHF